jgi:hypothetical protein
MKTQEKDDQVKKRKGRRKDRGWFDDPEVLYLEPDKQREVVLNPGRDHEWFKKTYPVTGELSLTRKVYNTDLPRALPGKIIAVTAIPKVKDKFKKIRDKLDRYRSPEIQGMLKAKPLGTYYELFEGGGYRVWTNPTEYTDVNSKRRRRRKNKRVPEDTSGSNIRIGDLEGFRERFSKSSGDHKKDDKTPRVERKS